MISVASIVEGDGEVVAFPILLRRLNQWRSPQAHVQIIPPIRVRRDRFLNKDEEFYRHLRLAAEKCGPDGWIYVLLDADDDCPVKLGAEIIARAKPIVPDRRLAVVLANREYEAWFLASAHSLNGHRNFSIYPDEFVDAEKPRNCKGWLSKHMSNSGYKETTDQPAFTAIFSLETAYQNSRSFRKLCNEWDKNF